MEEKIIKLGKSNVLKLEIVTNEGVSTGEYLEFDLEDIELPFIYQEMLDEEKKNKESLKNKFLIIDKKEDVKGEKLMSKNEEEKIKAINEFYKKEVAILNKFLGERGVEKLLNGRKIGWTTLDEISELISKQIAPYLDLTMDSIKDKIKGKYKTSVNDDEEVLK